MERQGACTIKSNCSTEDLVNRHIEDPNPNCAHKDLMKDWEIVDFRVPGELTMARAWILGESGFYYPSVKRLNTEAHVS